MKEIQDITLGVGPGSGRLHSSCRRPCSSRGQSNDDDHDDEDDDDDDGDDDDIGNII